MAKGLQTEERKQLFAAARAVYARGRKALAIARTAAQELLAELQEEPTPDRKAIAAAEQELQNVRFEIQLSELELRAISSGIADGVLKWAPPEVRSWYADMSAIAALATDLDLDESDGFLSAADLDNTYEESTGVSNDATLLCSQNSLTFYRAYVPVLGGEVPANFALRCRSETIKSKRKRGANLVRVSSQYGILTDEELLTIVRSVYAHRIDEYEKLEHAKKPEQENIMERLAVCDTFLAKHTELVTRIEAAAEKAKGETE